MSNQALSPAETSGGWLELQTRIGQAYRVKAADYDISERPEEEADTYGPQFMKLPVHWAVGSEGEPSSEFQEKTMISWYKLGKLSMDAVFEFRLTVVCKDRFELYFFDEEKAYYQLAVLDEGTHYIEYSSESPTIVAVTGF